jgi:hypothetical protein
VEAFGFWGTWSKPHANVGHEKQIERAATACLSEDHG